MKGVTIREACPDEVPALVQLTSEYVGTSYKWADRLGAGRSATESLALVAVDADGCIHGAVGVPQCRPAQPRSFGSETLARLILARCPGGRLTFWRLISSIVDRVSDEHCCGKPFAGYRAAMLGCMEISTKHALTRFGGIGARVSTSIRRPG